MGASPWKFESSSGHQTLLYEMYPNFKYHVFICQNQRPEGHPLGCCLSKGSDTILNYMKARVKELGLKNIRINKAGCLGACKHGPTVVVYPQGDWYTVQSVQEAEKIIQHQISNQSS